SLTKNINEKNIAIENNQIISEVFGELDENIDIIEKELDIKINIRDGNIKINGKKKDVEYGETLIHTLIEIIKIQKNLHKQDLRYALELVLDGKEYLIKEMLNEVISVSSTVKSIKPKTLGQKRYIDSMKDNDVVFGIGPAGTGKTYLAMAKAIQAFKNKEVNRIILTRPAVEAGEN